MAQIYHPESYNRNFLKKRPSNNSDCDLTFDQELNDYTTNEERDPLILNKRIQTLKIEIVGLKEGFHDQSMHNKSLERKLSKSRKDYSRIQRELSDAQTKARLAEKHSKECEKHANQAQTDLELSDKRVSEFFRDKFNKFKSETVKFQDLYNSERASLDSKNNYIENIKAELDENMRLINILRIENGNLRDQINFNGNKNLDIKRDHEISQKEERICQLTQNITAMSKEIFKLNSSSKSLRNENDKLVLSLNNFNEKYNKLLLESGRNEMFDKESIQALKQELTRERRNLLAATKKGNLLKTQIETKKEVISEYRKDLKLSCDESSKRLLIKKESAEYDRLVNKEKLAEKERQILELKNNMVIASHEVILPLYQWGLENKDKTIDSLIKASVKLSSNIKRVSKNNCSVSSIIHDSHFAQEFNKATKVAFFYPRMALYALQSEIFDEYNLNDDPETIRDICNGSFIVAETH